MIIGPMVIRTKRAKNQTLFLKILILIKDPSKMGDKLAYFKCGKLSHFARDYKS